MADDNGSIVGGLMGLRDPDLLLNVGLGLMSAAKYGGNVGDGLSQALGNYQQQQIRKQQIRMQQMQVGAFEQGYPIWMRAMQNRFGTPGQQPTAGPQAQGGAMTPTAGPAAPTLPGQAPQGLMGGDPMQDVSLAELGGMMGMPGAQTLMEGAKTQAQYDPSMILRQELAKNPLVVNRALQAAAAGDPALAEAARIKGLTESGALNVSRNGIVTGIGVPVGSLNVSQLNPSAGTTLAGGEESAIPGAAAARGQIAGTVKGAEELNTPRVMPTAGGGSAFGYPPTPPSLGGARGAAGAAKPAAQPTSQPQQTPKGPWANIPKLRIPQGIGEADLYTTGRLREASKADADLSKQLGSESALAEQQLEFNREAMKALPKAETGPLSDWLTKNRAMLQQLGVPKALIPDSGSVTPTMELNKALKNAALQGARQIYGPRMSQMEVRLQTEEMSPSSSMTRDAIASLMQQNNVRALYAKQRGMDYGKYQEQGGDPFKFESWYSSTFPLTKFAQAASASPAELRAEAKRRGLVQ